jgi:hypothetical protein
MAQSTTYLSKTYSGNGNRNKGTISVWCKFADTDASADSTIFGSGNISNDSDCTFLCINPNGFGGTSTRKISFIIRVGGGTVYRAESNALLRDINGWYHIVVRWDTTLGTPNCDIYLNGEEVSYSSNTWSSISQNTNTYIGSSAHPHYIGRGAYCDAMKNNYYEGSMSHFHYCDGYYYDASSFGSTDSTTGEWKINTSPSVSYGTNGFWFFKDDNALTDHSPNSNSYSLTAGTLTKTEDCPSNVFATLNALDNYYASSTFSHGNTSVVFNDANECFNYSTLGMSSGKFYFEGKQISRGSGSNERNYFGVTYSPPDASTDWLGNNNYSWGYRGDGKVYNSGQLQATYSSFTNGDIIGVALDVTNSKLYFSKNGVWQNSADPANGTNGLSVNAGKTYFFAIGETTSTSGVESCVNFGNGYFKTTAVSSAGTNASGIGIFEYDVPTGFTALSTKGLNE